MDTGAYERLAGKLQQMVYDHARSRLEDFLDAGSINLNQATNLPLLREHNNYLNGMNDALAALAHEYHLAQIKLNPGITLDQSYRLRSHIPGARAGLH